MAVGRLCRPAHHSSIDHAAQQITIDGQLCLKIDEWKSEENNYVLGNSMQDNAFFYVLINENVHFEYDYKPSREEIENDYLNLIAMEDIDRHEAEVFSRIEGTEDVAETESRFSVEETSDAFEPGQDFAVWDHGREDYYIKEDGTIPTFETKEEAEHYLQSMEPDTSGHDVQKYMRWRIIKKALLIEFNNTFNPYPERIPLYPQSGSRVSGKACLR